jgi:hypothetical protein
MISLSKKGKFFLTLLISGGLFISLCSFASAFEAGDKDTFYIDPSYDTSGRNQVSATLKNVSEKVYFYIEDEYWSVLSSNDQNSYLVLVNNIAKEFDNTIYPSLHYIFGSEWTPGIDNDERIIILLTDIKATAGGYFNSKDEFKKSEEPTSNEREMLYINATQINNPLMKSFIAHEFQHLIAWNEKERMQGLLDDVWLNEVRSEYAPTAAGYDSVYSGTNLERRIGDFLANPFDSLTEWRGDRFDYPPVNIFGHYLAEQFGEDIFSSMLKNNKVGIYSVEQAIKDKGFNFTFSQVFNNWTIANYLNNSSLSDGRYGYKNPYLRGAINVSPINYSIVSTSVISIAQNIKDWAPYWYRFINKQDAGTIAGDLEIEFEGGVERGNFNVFYIIEYFSRPTLINFLTLSNQKGVLKIPDFKNDIESVTIIVSNQFKKSGFNSNEESNNFVLSVATTIFGEEVPEPQPQSESNPNKLARPEDYGLKEGDLIRAQGDFDIFIINQYGYKRLFLNPTIFNMYGHLTGGWKAVKTVTPQVRDAFVTSDYYRYVDSPKVYYLEVTGGDTGMLHWVNMTSESFLSQGGKPESVFIINKSEFNWYPKGTDKASL